MNSNRRDQGSMLQWRAWVHELRQPIFAIKAASELAVQRPTTMATRVREIMEHVGYLEALLDGLADPGSAPQLCCDVRETVRGAVRLLDIRRELADASLDLDLGDAPLWVNVLGTSLHQVVMNLVQNAYDAVHGRPVRAVEIAVRATEAHVFLLVTDSGHGFDVDVSKRVGEPFVTTKAPGRGTGLGLYVTQRLVGELSGTMRVFNHDDGAVVEVRLPRAGPVR